MGTAVPATAQHAIELAPKLTEIDAAECRDLGEMEPLEALLHGVALSDKPLTILADDGEVIGMYGVASSPIPRTGIVWMLASDRLSEKSHALQFLRRSKAELDDMQVNYDVLYNYVDPRNTRMIRWLKWSGCRFSGGVHPTHHLLVRTKQCAQ